MFACSLLRSLHSPLYTNLYIITSILKKDLWIIKTKMRTKIDLIKLDLIHYRIFQLIHIFYHQKS